MSNISSHIKINNQTYKIGQKILKYLDIYTCNKPSIIKTYIQMYTKGPNVMNCISVYNTPQNNKMNVEEYILGFQH